jgi:hypothetical protein
VGKLRKSEIRPGIFLLEFPTQYELASTFVRVQEHWESRRFRSKVFTLEQYMDWYAAEFGNFTYFQDWAGFNIPSEALEPFRKGRFDPLSQKEKKLLRLFAGRTGDFYVIALTRNDPDRTSLKHELAHALFHTQPEYRRAVRGHLREHDTRSVRHKLLEMGYHPHVLEDEVHAYVLSERSFLPDSTRRRLAPLRRKLQRLFRRFSDAS